MMATVYKSTGSWYIVQDENGKAFNARIKGKFKIDSITSTNPVAVGDIVLADMENELENTVTITDIATRKNYITRSSPHNRHQHHIIASNLDQSLLFATLKEPKTSLGFIDRFLITSEAYHVPSIIVFNKSDLYKDLRLKTQDVSGWSGKGLHTTTFAEMFNLSFGGRLIDTPGIRELGLVDIPKHELSHYFPEMRALINQCHFNNCMHINEPDCAVKDAVNLGTVHPDRYYSYLNILDSIEKKSF